MRLIILPQALKISIPGIVNNFIGLFKDTTLVAFIGLLDPIGLTHCHPRGPATGTASSGSSTSSSALIFFVCCFGMSRYSQYLERKLHTDHR